MEVASWNHRGIYRIEPPPPRTILIVETRFEISRMVPCSLHLRAQPLRIILGGQTEQIRLIDPRARSPSGSIHVHVGDP